MKLYWFQVAPNPTKVRLAIAEKNAGGAGIDLDDAIVVLPKGEQNSDAHRARNPFATVPVLELDDGTHLIESLPIIEYLEERWPRPSLWGANAEARAHARDLERIVETRVLNPLIDYIHATNSPTGQPPEPVLAARAERTWPAALDYVEERLGDGRPFIAGDAPTVGDCTLAAALQFARFAKIDLLGGRAALTRWDQAYRARPLIGRVFTL